MRTKRSMEERFWAKVNKDGPVPEHCPELGNCWEWTGRKIQSGYGQFYLDNGRAIIASRAAFLAAGGDLCGGLLACHVCDNPGCVRNDSEGAYVVNGVARVRWGHLFGGTPADNLRDAARKGRRGYKYEEWKIRAALADWASGRGSRETIAIRYRLPLGILSQIENRMVYSHLLDELLGVPT